jgi:wyosine [tRNA(Phe)-imidazoG37] synthetase (radical SAM superfamily)
MCYTITADFKKNVNTKLMDFNLFEKVINEIGGKVPALRLSLRGEATLHPKFAQCIEYAKAKGIKEVSTLTHGGRLKPDFAEQIIKAGIDWITISVDGVGETYEKIRKPIKFAEILENIKGIGPETAKMLLKELKSVKKIQEASLELLINIIGSAKANLVKAYFEQ